MTKVEKIKSLIENVFNDLEFEEKEHKYKLKKGGELTSVSKSIESYKRKFDQDNISKAYAKKHKRRVSDVLAEWQEENDKSIKLGNRVHKYAEDYFHNRNKEPEDFYEENVIKFFNSLPDHMIPICSEVRIYDKSLGFAGTVDLLLYDTEKDGIVVGDYKTNKNIYKNFAGQKMESPFNYLLDSPFNGYQLQLSMYQIPLENIGLKVIGRNVIWFKSDNTYEVIPTDDYTPHLRYYTMIKTT